MRRKYIGAIDQRLALNFSENAESCGLQQLVDSADLPDETRAAIRVAMAAGFTLRSGLPHVDSQLLTEWLGKRWWLIHQSQLAHLQDWSGIIGSRFHRTDDDFCRWPNWIEGAVRSLARDQRTLLIVPETTTTSIVKPLARQANLNCVRVRLPPDSRKGTPTVGQWFIQTIEEVIANPKVAYATLWPSSALIKADETLELLPLRDRVIVALAHRLIALSIRPRGNVGELLNRRLRDVRFPAGTVSIRLPSGRPLSDQEWMDRQAVGWYLPTQHELLTTNAQMKPFTAGCAPSFWSPAVTQWTADAHLWNASSDYLLHCVRGDDGEAFRSGRVEAVVDSIAQGSIPLTSPYETLLKIIATRRLRASGKLLRTGASAVSFTGVPLAELMNRRRYHPHLGRWDWEPYGLMIRRDALDQLGARPVIYGDEGLFEQLGAVDRPYFQPAKRRSARSDVEHWQAEVEWRLLDDVRLSELPQQSLIVFVKTAAQAQELAAHFPWPVIYLPADRTPRSPTAAKRRRHISARTNKS